MIVIVRLSGMFLIESSCGACSCATGAWLCLWSWRELRCWNPQRSDCASHENARGYGPSPRDDATDPYGRQPHSCRLPSIQSGEAWVVVHRYGTSTRNRATQPVTRTAVVDWSVSPWFRLGSTSSAKTPSLPCFRMSLPALPRPRSWYLSSFHDGDHESGDGLEPALLEQDRAWVIPGSAIRRSDTVCAPDRVDARVARKARDWPTWSALSEIAVPRRLMHNRSRC